MTLWTTGDISFDFVDDMTDHPIVTLRITTPVGRLTFLAEPLMFGMTMVLKGLHVQDSTPNAVSGLDPERSGFGEPDGDRPGSDGGNGLGWNHH